MIEYPINLFVFFFGALSRLDTWDMDDGFLGGIKHVHDRIKIATAIEMVANAKGLQVSVAIQLLIISVADACEFFFILWSKDR